MAGGKPLTVRRPSFAEGARALASRPCRSERFTRCLVPECGRISRAHQHILGGDIGQILHCSAMTTQRSELRSAIGGSSLRDQPCGMD